ncbi:MAG: hypothetical protein WCY41_01775 [Candidatus Micrarchaeia archaeon]
MASCIKCGGPLGEFDAGGDMICQNCESAGGAQGGSANVQCQRCGMYLPSYELRMHSSRLYCSYCIMDIQDEEKRGKAGDGRAGEKGNALGICERCGRETDTLYAILGRKLCSNCYSVGAPGGASPGGASLLSLFVEKMALALGVRQKPKVIQIPPPGKIGIRAPSEQEDNERRRKSQERFNLKERRMMEEEEGQLGIEEPLSEGRRKEKKPAPDARKQFFSQHTDGKK